MLAERGRRGTEIHMNKSTDYKHIRAWGYIMKSFDYYILTQQEKAAYENAPLDACYERNGKWHCASDMRAELQQELKNNL